MTEDQVETQEIVQTKGHMMDVASPVLAVEIPCGVVDPDDPSVIHSTMVVHEMTGREEDLLTGKGAALPRINQIIANCTDRIGNISDRAFISRAVGSLSASDRMVALIAIRRASLGDFYEVKVNCPKESCGRAIRYTLNLSEIEIRPMSDRGKRQFEHALPSGRIVQWHVMTSQDEEWLNAKARRKEDVLTLAILSRVDSVGDVKIERDKNKNEAMEVIKSLTTRDRNFIRTIFEQNEGHVDTNVDFLCPECEHEWQAELEIGQKGFFFPSVS